MCAELKHVDGFSCKLLNLKNYELTERDDIVKAGMSIFMLILPSKLTAKYIYIIKKECAVNSTNLSMQNHI